METPAGTVYRFGPFEVDATAGELLKQGKRISLQEQPFRLLIVLLESSGGVVTRAEIQSRIWEGNAFGDFDAGLRVAVGKLRTALGDDAANPRYIETIPRQGYRFLGPAIQVAASSESDVAVRQVLQPSTPSRRFVLVGLLGLFIAGAFLFFSFIHRGARSLTDKDTVVLADFKNQTGDPVFDETLRQGMTISLEQSPFLSLISSGRIQQTLRLMGRPAGTSLTPEIAREICERTASAAVLEGSIASLGSHYVLGLRAVSCAGGDVLAEEQAQAAQKEDVLNALSGIAGKFRTRVGESIRTVQQHNAPLDQVTTPSLEALKAYSTGHDEAIRGSAVVAVRSLRRAIELDPGFAMAYSLLGRLYGDTGEQELSAENSAKAFQLRDRASDEERYWISASYEKQVTGNLEKAQQIILQWIVAYPRTLAPHGLMSGHVSWDRGNYEESVREARIALEIDPDFAYGYSNLAISEVALGRLDDAAAAVKQASQRKLDLPEFLIQRYMLAFVKGDKAAMDREVAEARKMPGLEDWMSNAQSFVLAYAGHLEAARRMSRQAGDFAHQEGRKEAEAQYQIDAALREALFGNMSEARQMASAGLNLSSSRDVEFGAAFALALSGDSSRSPALADELDKRFPEDTKVRFSYVPSLRALIALHRNAPATALDLLHSTTPYEDGIRASGGSEMLLGAGTLYSVYLRGEIYLAAKDGRGATAEFQKILDHRGIVMSDPIGALAHLQLGRAYALSGIKDKARIAYIDFLGLWKEADSGIPILKQARAEFAKLQ